MRIRTVKSIASFVKTPALLFLFALVLCWKVILSNEYTLFAFPDNSRQVYAWFQYIAANMHRGVPAFWDYTVDAGRSFIGEMQAGAFYPPNLLMAALPLNRHGQLSLPLMEGFVILHLFLASLWMYLLARSMNLSPFPSMAAGLAYAYSGSLAGHAFGQLNLFYSCVWIPLVFLFAIRSWQARSWSRKLLFTNLSGLFLALSMLAGHHQPLLYTGLALILTAVFFSFERTRYGEHWNLPPKASLAQIFAVPVLIFFFFISYGAVQLVPSLEYSLLAYRWFGDGFVQASSPIPYSHSGTDANLGPRAFLNALFPYLGTADTSPYIGILPLALGLFAVSARRENRGMRWCLLLSVSFLVMAMGGFTPIHGLVYFLVPGMNRAREAARALLIAHLGFSLLAAYGIEALLKPAGRRLVRQRRILAAVVCAVGLLLSTILFACYVYQARVLGQNPNYDGLFWTCLLLFSTGGLIAARHYSWLGRFGLRALLCVILVCDYYFYLEPAFQLKRAYDAKSNYYPRQYYREDGILRFLAGAAKPFRVEFRDDLYPPNIGEVYGLETLNSYSATALVDYRDLVSSDYSAGGTVHNLLNVRYVVSNEALALPRVFEDGDRKVYENPNALPRAWLVRRLVSKPDAVPITSAIKDPAFNPSETAIISAGVHPPTSWNRRDTSFSASVPTAPAEVFGYVRNSAQRVRLKVRTSTPAMLVLSEVWYPGWSVKLNGNPARLLRVDGALRGVFVEPGEWQVEFSYRPAHFYPALAAGIGSLLLMVGLAWRVRTSGSEQS